MQRNQVKPPRALLIIAAILVGVAIIAGPLIIDRIPEEELGRYVLVTGIPFLAIFIAILLCFIYFIFVMAARYNGVIRRGVYHPIETIIMLGIVLGVIGMFQPFTIVFYQIGFHVLLISTLAFIVWSHVTPRGEHRDEDATGPVSVIEAVPAYQATQELLKNQEE